MVDADLIAGYLDALRAAKKAISEADRERAEARAASHWFAMDGATQAAATLAAAKGGILEPRTDRHGLKLYPVVRGEKVLWVTVPAKETE